MDERELELMICAAACEVVNQSRLVHGVYIVPASVMEVLGGLVLGQEADSEEILSGQNDMGTSGQQIDFRPLSVDEIAVELSEDSEDDEDFDIESLARDMPIQSMNEIRTLSPMEFIRGGKAVFTLTDTESGRHFTYRINRWQKDLKYPPKWFVNLGTGYNDSVKFCEVLGLRDLSKGGGNGQLATTGWVVADQAPSRVLFQKFIKALNIGRELPDVGIKFQHAGRCCMCSRELTAPESIEMGIGPECLGNAGLM